MQSKTRKSEEQALTQSGLRQSVKYPNKMALCKVSVNRAKLPAIMQSYAVRLQGKIQ